MPCIHLPLQQVPNCPPDVHDAASECVVNALYLVEDMKRHQALAGLLQSGVYESASAFNAAVANEELDK